MIDFIIQYWPTLAIAAIEIVSIILVIIIGKKKGISTDAIKVIIANKIPSLVSLAEASGSTGKEKLGFVVMSCLALVKKYVSNCDESFWIEYIIEQVEAILSTPQKKEAFYGEKNITK